MEPQRPKPALPAPSAPSEPTPGLLRALLTTEGKLQWHRHKRTLAKKYWCEDKEERLNLGNTGQISVKLKVMRAANWNGLKVQLKCTPMWSVTGDSRAKQPGEELQPAAAATAQLPDSTCQGTCQGLQQAHNHLRGVLCALASEFCDIDMEMNQWKRLHLGITALRNSIVEASCTANKTCILYEEDIPLPAVTRSGEVAANTSQACGEQTGSSHHWNKHLPAFVLSCVPRVLFAWPQSQCQAVLHSSCRSRGHGCHPAGQGPRDTSSAEPCRQDTEPVTAVPSCNSTAVSIP